MHSTCLSEIEFYVNYFEEKMGTDIQTYTQMNELWHTGHPRQMRDQTSVADCRPWEWVERIAAGTSCPPMMAKAERWQEVVKRAVTDHCFSQ